MDTSGDTLSSLFQYLVRRERDRDISERSGEKLSWMQNAGTSPESTLISTMKFTAEEAVLLLKQL